MNDKLELITLNTNSYYDQTTATTAAMQHAKQHYTLYYVAGLGVFTLLGYAYILAFPSLAVISAYSLFTNIQSFDFHNLQSISFFVIQTSALLLSLVMMLYLFQNKPSLPAGRPLNEHEAPRLIQIINELSAELHLPTIHRIRITRDYEISLIRTPRSGYPFRHTNTLIIGLPFMQCLTPAQFRTAVHRELLRLSGSLSRSSRLFYFNRQTWTQYQATYQTDYRPQTLVMRIFLSWYAPLYRYYARQAVYHEELAIDKLAHHSNKSNDLVDMLTATMLAQRFLDEEFWPGLYNKAYKYHTPPFMPYSCLEIHYRNKLLPRIAQLWLDESLQTRLTSETMPDFYTRVNNLDVWNICLPCTLEESAASYFLDASCDIIIDQMDNIWFKTHQYQWQKKFKKGQLERNKLKELKVQASQGLLSDIKTMEYIQLINKYVDRHEAISLYKKLLEINYKNSSIYFEIGRNLITLLDADGVKVLEHAMTMDMQYTVAACHLITQYYVQTGNSRHAQPYRRRALAYQVEAA